MLAKLILVTGANGFIAAHCVQQLLQRGYRVRGTIRSESKGTHLKKIFSKHVNQLELVIVSDITAKGAFNEAVKGVDAVLHVASPFFNPKGDVYEELINPAIRGTVGVLQSVHDNNDSQCSRVVVTSSFASVVDTKNRPEDHRYTEADWNNTNKSEDGGMLAYRASKVMAERAAWEFVKEANPKFDLVTICPPLVIGPLLHETNGVEQLNTSNNSIWGLLSGKAKPVAAMGFVDVRDVAKSHVLALEVPEAGGKRFLCASDYKSFAEIADMLRKMYPKEPIQTGSSPYPVHATIDTCRIKEILKMDFIPLEESLKATCDELLALRDAGVTQQNHL
ncbi:hypothetical protein SeMB42_g05555 [Synchytrium endobioticum]|uniref:NAD-dependent epimerase/dehydratase domain-containing protein n=1 Tax=Synchytrium endobioticum TaxID=286115 RepID=A0A507CU90_9FUNG|nr:hypothetical protein SeMB42_g05555 [Synchytrium endobioticum]TPX42640.1 hypothetical protein SeLEV6574_g05489 [Synchytrium endobioticum]